MYKTRFIYCSLILLSVFNMLSFSALGEAAASLICPKNEFYTDCGENCQTECATLNKPCYIRHIRCPDGCYCNKGYARDASGTCVPISEC